MTSPKGWPTTKKSGSSIPGFTNDQTQVPSEHATLQPSGSDKVALDITQRCAFLVTANNAVAAGSSKRIIVCVGIGATARKGDLIKFTTGNLSSVDAPILSVPNANTLILGTELDAIPSAGDLFELCRYTFFKVDSMGQITATSGPVQIKRDNIDTYVSEDTTDAANRPMPMGLMIKDETGKWVPVVLDQTAPYSNRPIPVALTDITGGAVVNVTASGLNVKIVHNGADPSSIRIGDGTTLAGVTLNNELKTSDAKLLAELQRLNAKLVNGDCDDYTIDNVTGVTLFTGAAKKIKINQDGGEILYIYKNAVKLGCLGKGDELEFNVDMIVTDKLIVKSKSGSVVTNLCWNIFN